MTTSVSKEWIQEGKSLAPELRASAKASARSMFETGDLRSFLDILQRLSHFDAYNLILIQQQYPRATCLAGYKAWENRLADDQTYVLRPEFRGNPINAVYPFLDRPNGKDARLIWFAVKLFDVSQTHVRYSEPSAYIPDELHSQLLIEAACEVLSTEYGRTVYHQASDPKMKAAGIVGQMTDMVIAIRDDAKAYQQLDWLIDCLCTLHGGEQRLPNACRTLLRQCVKHALWLRWSLERPPSLFSFRNKIRELSEDIQMEFLDCVQRVFRSIEESIAAAYVKLRENREEEHRLHELDEEILRQDIRPQV